MFYYVKILTVAFLLLSTANCPVFSQENVAFEMNSKTILKDQNLLQLKEDKGKVFLNKTDNSTKDSESRMISMASDERLDYNPLCWDLLGDDMYYISISSMMSSHFTFQLIKTPLQTLYTRQSKYPMHYIKEIQANVGPLSRTLVLSDGELPYFDLLVLAEDDIKLFVYINKEIVTYTYDGKAWARSDSYSVTLDGFFRAVQIGTARYIFDKAGNCFVVKEGTLQKLKNTIKPQNTMLVDKNRDELYFLDGKQKSTKFKNK